MEINKNKLLKALTTVSIGLANKEMIQQSTSIIFTPGMISTYNDEIAVTYRLEEVDFTGAIASKELIAFCKKAKTENISLNINADTGNEILIKAGRSRAGLTLEADIVLPKAKIPKEFTQLPKDFKKAVKFALSCTDTDFSNPVLTNAYITKDGVIGACQTKVAVYKYDTPLNIPNSVLIPAHHISKIINNDITSIALDDSWAHFKAGDAVISGRIFEGKYVDFSKLLEHSKDKQITFPKEIIDVLDRADTFSKNGTTAEQVVEIALQKNKADIKSRNDSGWFSEKVKIKYPYTDCDITFDIQPQALQTILQVASECYITSNRIIFINKSFIYVTMITIND